MPMTLAAMSPVSAASKSGTGMSALVESFGGRAPPSLQHDRRVAHRFRHRPGLIER
jgi:hypothetical protein